MRLGKVEAVNISGWKPRLRKNTSLTPRGDGCTCKQTGNEGRTSQGRVACTYQPWGRVGVGTMGLAMDRVLFRQKENSTLS